MHQSDDRPTDQLDDAQLLVAEQSLRDAYDRLRRQESHDTTYRSKKGSPALITAWERWWKTNLAARLRGILSR